MRSPVAISNGCAPVLASYSAITLFTSSMSAVAGSYLRSVVSPWDENVRILAVMFDLLRDVHLRSSVEQQSTGFGSPPLILHRFSGLSIHNGRRSRPHGQGGRYDRVGVEIGPRLGTLSWELGAGGGGRRRPAGRCSS